MSWIDDTIDAFGRSIGIADMRLDDEGSVRLALPNGGLMGLLNLDDTEPPEMMVYRSEPLQYEHARKLRRALHLGDFRHPRDWPLQAGVQEGSLYLALRLPQRSFTLDALERAWSQLTRLHAELDGRT